MVYLKQSTAITVHIGPFLDDTDGKTAETGLTISQADVRLSKNGGDMAQKNDANACVHDEIGHYTCQLDATDTNTCGRLRLMVHESGALPVWDDFMVVNANVFDSLFAAATTDYLQVDTVQVEGVDATNQIRDSVVDDATRIDASSVNAIEAKVDTIDGIVDNILVDTGTDIPAAIGALNNISSGDVETAVAAILDAANTELATIPATTDSLRKMLQFCFEYWRNARTETATTESLKKEDGSTELGSRTLGDDGTTFSRGEMS